MIEDYNEAVREARIDLLPCAYLHNYKCAEPPAYDRLLDPSNAYRLSNARTRR